MMDSKQFILENLLRAYQDNYREHRDRFRVLDNKAQSIMTVAGIFIAGIFTFVAEHYQSDHNPSSPFHLPLLVEQNTSVPFHAPLLIATLLLIACLGCGIMVMLGKQLDTPPPMKEVYRTSNDILRPENLADVDAYPKLFVDTIKTAWEESSRSLKTANAFKSCWLRAAQLFLLAALVVVAIFIILALWS